MKSSFRERVYEILRCVPPGKVVTYGQLALLAGHPRGARQVGWIAHTGLDELPWQRVVNRLGGLATGYRGGRRGHKKDLEDDGVPVREDLTVDLARYQWWPDEDACRRLDLSHDIRAHLARNAGQSRPCAEGPRRRNARRRNVRRHGTV